MGMVFVHLSDEEKLQVLLLAVFLFLVALIISICLSVSLCPLNKWLIERHSRRRRRLLEQQQQRHQQIQYNHHLHYQRGGGGSGGGSGRHYALGNMIMNSHFWSGPYNQQYGNKSASLTSYSGPPPAYEAALRATRLQSLTGSLPPLVDQSGKPIETIDWTFNNNNPKQQQPHQQSLCIPEKQLDFGDYFHQPREPEPNWSGNAHVYIPISDSMVQEDQGRSTGGRRLPPVMLRLWVRMMEPGELVARAQKARNKSLERQVSVGSTGTESRRLSLTRQLSIPQFFGSLVTLASGGKSLQSAEQVSHHHNQQQQQQQEQQKEANQESSEPIEMNSIVSSTSSSSATEDEITGNQSDQQQEKNELNQQVEQQTGQQLEHEPKQEKGGPSGRRRRTSATSPAGHQLRALSASGSITSRVLHMNVASFSYVKDESLISTKKHNQMNFHHFCSNLLTSGQSRQEQQAKQSAATGKSCQLLISICDVENLLNSSWLQEKACALLAPSSSVYVQCEILTSKGSKSSRILRYPLKALNVVEPDPKTHTVNFASTLPAAAVERPAAIPFGPPLASGSSPVVVDSSLASSDSSSLTRSSLASSGAETLSAGPTTTATTNWRHEPSADGKSIVVFSSVPKQIAQSQQQTGGSVTPINSSTTTTTPPLPPSDLIQFDSVFVSPILSKSTIEDGFVRFRFYSQCKYVNETCLAELKLPLRQLLQSETRDNLGDALGTGHSLMQFQQAELILDNLLSNLVTASTGSPLSALIEQISAEERESSVDLSSSSQQLSGVPPPTTTGGVTETLQAANSPATLTSSFRLPWTLSVPPALSQPEVDRAASGIRTSCSLSNSLNKLSAFATNISDNNNEANNNNNEIIDELNEEKRRRMEFEEHERQIERNYCRSLLVSHWLNYLAAPAYECQLMEEVRGKVILGLTYLPTSNRVIFNAHRATIDNDSYSMGSCGGSSGKHMMKNLRLQSSTCYLLRFLMVANGRVVKKKQTPAARKPEWDGQEAITFDLVNVSVDQPSFIVTLVVRNASAFNTGSLQNIRRDQSNCFGCGCLTGGATNYQASNAGHHQSTRNSNHRNQAQSEPESLEHYSQTKTSANLAGGQGGHLGSLHAPNCPLSGSAGLGGSQRSDLVIGHLVLGEDIWREMRVQPRKQIVKQFKIY